MLGVCLRLVQYPDRIHYLPYLVTVEDEETKQLVMAASMTPPFNLVLYREGETNPAAMEAIAKNLQENGWTIPGVLGKVEVAEAFTKLWSGLTGKEYHLHKNIRNFELTEVIPPAPCPGKFRIATHEDISLIAEWVYEFQVEALGRLEAEDPLAFTKTRIGDGDVFIWEDNGQVVSMCAKLRPTRHSIAIAQVYTPPELRGKGYAANCVASLSQYLLDSGYKFCTLNTDLANPISNRIYQKMGYRPVCDLNEFRFTE
jgi:predicted GNAT family acetyltransferase